MNVIPEAPFLVVPEVSSERREYVPIGWLEPPVIPSNKLRILADATLAQFAVLTSAMHMAWLRYVGGRLESRYSYGIGMVYNTFPMPPATLICRSSILGKGRPRRSRHYPDATLADLYDPDLMPPDLPALTKRLTGRWIALRRTGFTSERERAEHLFMLYEKMRAPLGIGIKKPKRRRR